MPVTFGKFATTVLSRTTASSRGETEACVFAFEGLMPSFEIAVTCRPVFWAPGTSTSDKYRTAASTLSRERCRALRAGATPDLLARLLMDVAHPAQRFGSLTEGIGHVNQVEWLLVTPINDQSTAAGAVHNTLQVAASTHVLFCNIVRVPTAANDTVRPTVEPVGASRRIWHRTGTPASRVATATDFIGEKAA